MIRGYDNICILPEPVGTNKIWHQEVAPNSRIKQIQKLLDASYIPTSNSNPIGKPCLPTSDELTEAQNIERDIFQAADNYV